MLQDTERTRSMWACTCPEDDATRSVAASIITAARALLVQELRAALPAVQVAEIASVTSNRKWNVQVGVAMALPRPKDMFCVCVSWRNVRQVSGSWSPMCVTANQCAASLCWQITG